jgi:Fic family protein
MRELEVDDKLTHKSDDLLPQRWAGRGVIRKTAVQKMSMPALVKLVFGPPEPIKLWRECLEARKKWEQQKKSVKLVKKMEKFSKKMGVKFVLLTNSLEDTLPNGVDKTKLEELLDTASDVDDDEAMFSNEPQLQQHLKAFKLLNCPLPPQLTEELIKEVHGVMMQDLKNEDGLAVNAGLYRRIPVHCGSICSGYNEYPSWECIPDSMSKIVKEYEEKMQDEDHDPFALASWLYFKVVSLHPFVDGNGRVSRLLWCYSLMRDSLPFPAILSSGHKRAQKHLLFCLKRDSTPLMAPQVPHITTLTVLSVHNAWQEYSQFVLSHS